MRLGNFDLNLLIAFDALLEERNVTRAAARLNVTQSAMSASLKRLRESFQDDILTPYGKKMIPTPHALALAAEVGRTLIHLRSLVATGTGFDPATSTRQFRIVASDYSTTVLLVPVIERLHTEAPGIVIELSLPNEMSGRRLDQGEVDLILMPDDFMETDHPRELLFEERHVIVGDRKNPLFERLITEEDFLRSGHVAIRIAGLKTFGEAILDRRFPDRRIEVTAQSFIQVPWLLRGTQRLALMHERLARVTLPVFDLAMATPPFALPMMPEMMQYHVSRSADAGLTWLRKLLIETAASVQSIEP